MRPVVIAVRALPVGHRLTAQDLARRSWPAKLAPDNASARPDDLLGKLLASPVARGEPLSKARVLGRDLTSGLGAEQVAAVVGVDDPVAVALVRPGDRVDVLASAAPPDPGDPLAAAAAPAKTARDPVLVIENARVLAVLAAADRLQPRSDVVVATTREAAARLLRASSSQKLTVLPRSP